MAFRMRHDPNGEAFFQQLRDCEADAVYGDGPLGRYIVTEVGRKFDLQSVIIIRRFKGDHARGAINVTLNEMATEPAVGSESSFEIDRAATAKVAQVCAIKSFLQQIESQMFVPAGGDREAATVHRNAIAAVNVWRDAGRGQLKLRSSIGRSNPTNEANVLDQSCKHMNRPESMSAKTRNITKPTRLGNSLSASNDDGASEQKIDVIHLPNESFVALIEGFVPVFFAIDCENREQTNGKPEQKQPGNRSALVFVRRDTDVGKTGIA